MAALLLSYSPSLTPAQLQSDITSSATAITLRTLDNGMTVACGSDCVRYGRLNALGALEAAGYSATVAPAISFGAAPRAPIRPTRTMLAT